MSVPRTRHTLSIHGPVCQSTPSLSGPVQQKPWNTLSYCPSVPYPVIKSIRFSPVQFFLLPFAPYLVASLTPLSQRYTLFWAAYSVSKRQSGHTPTLTRSIPLVLTRHTNQFLLLFAIRSSIHTSIHTCSPTSRSLSTTSDNSDREEPGKITCSHHKRGSRRTRNTRSDFNRSTDRLLDSTKSNCFVSGRADIVGQFDGFTGSSLTSAD